MACRGEVLVAVLAVFLGLLAEQQVTFVSGDKQLIDSACAEASKLSPCLGCDLQVMDQCHSCFTNQPGSEEMSIKDLGVLAIYCASSACRKARNTAVEMIGVSAINNCLTVLRDTDLRITDAAVVLNEGRYADAAKMITDRPSDVLACSDSLKEINGTVDLVKQITDFQYARINAEGVVLQIH